MKVLRFATAGIGLAIVFLLTAQAPQPEKFPKNKWFNGVKGYNEALELQKQTGADIFLYFERKSPKDEAGLCSWFEKRGMAQPGVSKYLQDYLKVKITLPLNRDDTEAMSKFGFNKCPAIYIVQTDGRHGRCAVFDWPGDRPKIREPDALIQTFREKSGPRYQVGAGSAVPEPVAEPTPSGL